MSENNYWLWSKRKFWFCFRILRYGIAYFIKCSIVAFVVVVQFGFITFSIIALYWIIDLLGIDFNLFKFLVGWAYDPLGKFPSFSFWCVFLIVFSVDWDLLFHRKKTPGQPWKQPWNLPWY